MFCDLHTHSTFSDGTFSPTEIVLKAKEIGLDAVALCDHNTVAGLDEFVSAGKKYGVTTVAGIEFSTEYNSKQLHIVGLFIKKENYSDITEIMAESQKLKEESNKLLVKNLAKDGYILDYDEIKSNTVDGFVNRANIAAAIGMTKRIKTTVYIALNRDLTVKSKPMPASLTMFSETE